MSQIKLFGKDSRAVIVVSGCNKGIIRVASFLAEDLRRVTGSSRQSVHIVYKDEFQFGSYEDSSLFIFADINEYGSPESYKLSTHTSDNSTIVTIVGNDLLGAEYGLLYISELCGVSPWHYFADVPVKEKDIIILDSDLLNTESKVPSIELRGFFMNDEWPSLGNWVHETFGGFNELFYEHVFELLLRLKGNFLWPAMWTGVFSEDGKAYPRAIAEMADEFGITMGTSHHEPLFRAGEEFSHLMSDSNDVGYGKDWNFHSNREGLIRFWTDSVKRNKDLRSLITIGMRGERDSKILGEDATLGDNIDLLKETILAQKKILKENGLEGAPKVLALYKEVEDYYYGDEEYEGLNKWEELDDCLLLLSDDNFGNLRTVPDDNSLNRKAGWGLYYHFDYHGGPISYEWVNSSPIARAREQLTTAYENNIRKLWVVNVGDLRPQEYPLSYYMSLAYDYETYSQEEVTNDFCLQWIKKQFGEYIDNDLCNECAECLNSYVDLNAACRPEATHPDTFSIKESDEAYREYRRAQDLIDKVNDLKQFIPNELQDAFYGLIEFPALASANLRQMMLLKGAADKLKENAVSFTNDIAEKLKQTIDIDIELVRRYNEDMAGGKWRHMMSSKHVNFINWNDEGSEYPEIPSTEPKEKGTVYISVNRDTPVKAGVYNICLSESVKKISVYIMTDAKEIPDHKQIIPGNISITQLFDHERLKVYELSDLTADLTTVVFGGVTVNIYSKKEAAEEIRDMIFMENYVNIDSHDLKDPDKHVEVIRRFGKYDTAVRIHPLRGDFENIDEAPFADFEFETKTDMNYITFFIAATNNPFRGKGRRIIYSIDDGELHSLEVFPQGFNAGENSDDNWCQAVLYNGRKISEEVNLKAGKHKLRFIRADAGLVLQKIEIADKKSGSFYGYK